MEVDGVETVRMGEPQECFHPVTFLSLKPVLHFAIDRCSRWWHNGWMISNRANGPERGCMFVVISKETEGAIECDTEEQAQAIVEQEGGDYWEVVSNFDEWEQK